MSYDENQTLVPASFIALYADARGRLTRADVAARHELCEDMASMLSEHCRNVHHAHHLAEDEILRRCLHGLLEEPSSVEPAEAEWVVHRTAELLQWRWGTE